MVHVSKDPAVRKAGKSAIVALILSSTALTPVHVKATELPVGANVVSGQADITSNGSQMLINQGSQNAIINWDSFSVGNGAGVAFNNGNGATLNRVQGTSTSYIDGSLSATGSLYLINQNGVVIGKDGVIQTGGKFVASTLDISDADFLDGGDMTFSGDSSASVINLGKVGSLGGDIALIARHVTNEGELTAPNGTVGLAAGREVLMRDASLNDGMFLVKVGDADSSVTEAGLISAATAELRANGGNIYALAGNNGGAINATGASTSGGRIFLTAGGGKVRVTKKVRATRGGNGGEVFINADEVSITGLLQADGLDGVGGNIDIGGLDISLEGATADASGTTGGGRIRVGGEYQGGDFGDLMTAENVSIDASSTLSVDAGVSGDGGEVIVWSNDRTDFQGAISARGENGGFAEVSGKESLGFTGLVDLGGTTGEDGTLLLDPSDFTIGAAEATAIVTALGSASVVISTGVGPDFGDIFVNSALNYSSGNDLSLLAHRHIVANASIQNSGAGDLNLIAGWDGVTEMPGSSGIAAGTIGLANFVAGTYGNGGDIYIGDGTQTTGIAVGSSGGTTTALARDLLLTGSDTDDGFAQLGFNGAATGNIDVTLSGDLTATGGGAEHAYAQLGHGGYETYQNLSGNIDVDAGGNIALAAGTASPDPSTGETGSLGAFAQIGHGGFREDNNSVNGFEIGGDINVDLDGNLSVLGGAAESAYAMVGHGGRDINVQNIGLYGDVTVNASGDIALEGGTTLSVTRARFTFAQIGHGGFLSDGPQYGNVNVTGSNISLTGGEDQGSYAQIGLGGYSVDGIAGGHVTVTASGNLDLTGGDRFAGYAQIGSKGFIAGGGGIGDTKVNVGGSLNVLGGAGARAYAQIGQGAADFGDNADIAGDIAIIVDGTTTLESGTGGYWIGHATNTSTGGTYSGDVALVTNGLSVTGGDFAGMIRNDLLGGDVLIANTHAQIGDADSNAPDFTDDIIYDGTSYPDSISTDSSLSLLATGEVTFERSLQIEGAGNINLVAGWDGTTGLNLTGFPMFSMTDIANTVGAYGSSTGGAGDNGDVNIREFNDSNDVNVGAWMGTVNVFAHDLEVKGSDGGYSSRLGAYANNNTSIDSDINITVADDVTVIGGDGADAYAAIGHGFGDASGTISGDILISSINSDNHNEVIVAGGDGDDAYAQIGHNNYDGAASGSIRINGEDISVGSDRGHHADGEGAYAQIGHYGWLELATPSAIGHIEINASGDLVVVGGDGSDTYARIGHEGTYTNGAIDINTSSVGTNVFVGYDSYPNSDYFARGDDAVSQIGHNAFYIASGVTTVNADNYLVTTGGDGDYSYSLVGHQAYQVMNGSSISISSGYEAYVEGGYGLFTPGQIGHLTGSSDDNSIEVSVANNLFVSGFEGYLAGGHIGHTGLGTMLNSVDVSGDVNVKVGGNIELAGDDTGFYAGAAIGHLSVFGTIPANLEGDINITADGEFSLDDGAASGALAWVGHFTDLGTVSNSNVFIQAFGFDRDTGSLISPGDLGSFNKDIIILDIPAGDFTLIATGTGLKLEDPVYNSPFQLLVSVNNDLVLGPGATFTNTGTGDIILAAGDDFHNDTGSLTPIVTGGRWLIYSTRPDNNRDDIEITNWDFLRYSTVFDINDPTPSTFASGNGLIYEVTPVVDISASDETIFFGQTPVPVVTQSLSVNGVAVNPADFGLMFDTSSPNFGYGPNVLLNIYGQPLEGSYPAGLEPNGLVTTYYGIVVNSDPGDLTVLSTGTTPPSTTVTTPTGSNVAFGVCSPSEDDLNKKAYDQNTGQICTLLPAADL